MLRLPPPRQTLEHRRRPLSFRPRRRPHRSPPPLRLRHPLHPPGLSPPTALTPQHSTTPLIYRRFIVSSVPQTGPTHSFQSLAIAAIPGTTVHNLFLSQYCERNRELKTRYSEEYHGFSMRRIHPMQAWTITRADPPAMQFYTLDGHQIAHGNKSSVICHADQYTSSVPFLEKVEFGILQNGSEIRSVAIAGVEREPVNLTEPVSEAIAAVFTG